LLRNIDRLKREKEREIEREIEALKTMTKNKTLEMRRMKL